MKKQNNAGFTLIELVVAMAIAVIVTASAASVLLMGLQVNRQSVDTANRQMTVRTLLNVMESAAAEGKINAVVTAENSSWQLQEVVGEGDAQQKIIIFHYNAETQEILTNGTTDPQKGTAVLKGVYASNAFMEGQLLNLSIETEEGTFTSSVYCRLADPETAPGIETLPGGTEGTVGKFLDILKSQYRSRGEIRVKNETTGEYEDSGVYYSLWWRGYNVDPSSPYFNQWGADTPWCACYVSWALSQVTTGSPNNNTWYAHVDEFIKHFQTGIGGEWTPRAEAIGTNAPAPGDLIFFDWNKGTDPSHMGVVLSVTSNMVYTIEGNSAGRVTVRSYALGDSRIIGYGRIFG